MPTVTIGSNTYNIQRHQVAPFRTGAAHQLMDGTFKQDVYSSGVKRRFYLGSDVFTATEIGNLNTTFTTGGSFSFTDLDSNAYTVMFEEFELPEETRLDIPWANRRYKSDFVLREV